MKTVFSSIIILVFASLTLIGECPDWITDEHTVMFNGFANLQIKGDLIYLHDGADFYDFDNWGIYEIDHIERKRFRINSRSPKPKI